MGMRCVPQNAFVKIFVVAILKEGSLGGGTDSAYPQPKEGLGTRYGRPPPTNTSFSVTTTKILNGAFLRHTTQLYFLVSENFPFPSFHQVIM